MDRRPSQVDRVMKKAEKAKVKESRKTDRVPVRQPACAERIVTEGRLLLRARGHVKILDRQKLEETVCECYRVVKGEFVRLLG